MDYSWLSAAAEEVTSVARSLLGWQIVANGVRIRLTETEAYLGGGRDPASHADRGVTPRNSVMFGPAGVAYVYWIYGAHHCLNVVCGHVGEASAVLLRAGEVVEGIDVAGERRPTARTSRDLARGPACLVRALGVDERTNNTSMVDGFGPVQLFPPAELVVPSLIRQGPRVGVGAAHDLPWRYWLADDPTVSAYRGQTPRRRAS